MNISPELFIKHNIPEIEVNMKTNISGYSIQTVSDFLLDLIEKVKPVRDLENKTKDLLNAYLSKCKFRLFAEHWLIKAFSNDETYVLAFNYLAQKVNRESGDVIHQIKPVGDISLSLLQQEQSLTTSPKFMDTKPRKIFISHSSIDKKIVNEFIEKILILGLGLNKREHIFSTSDPLSSIKSGEDFKETIKKELINAKAVIQFISENYKKSEVCIIEMGAAWGCCDNVIPFIIPPLKYDVGFAHANTQQLKLDSKEDLMKFYEDHKGKLFDSECFSALEFNQQIDKFLNFLSNLDYQKTKKVEKETFIEKGFSAKNNLVSPKFYGKYVIKKTVYGYKFFLKAKSGESIIASERYTTKYACENGIESVKKNSSNESQYEKKISSSGLYYFNLKASNGEIIGTSELYNTDASMENAIKSVMYNGPNSQVIDES